MTSFQNWYNVFYRETDMNGVTKREIVCLLERGPRKGMKRKGSNVVMICKNRSNKKSLSSKKRKGIYQLSGNCNVGSNKTRK